MKSAHNKYRNLTDRELINCLSKGEIGSYDELYNRYWKKLYLYGYKLFKEEDICQDIVQEVFLDLWRRRFQLNIENVSAFLYQMTKFQLARHLRKTKIKNSYLETMDEVNFVCNVLEQVEFNELKNHLDNVMESLPEKCRNVFYLSRFENLSNKEIGIKMDISVSTVEKHNHKALKFIKSSLEGFK